ncbi:hypothetical protein ACV90N_003260 [Klebsiella pneumoniae]|uniref:hypothetical protein n=1 Tax=Klebsiella pneumoniae complex TaxID=3390273 RepID=UPI000E0111A9|nr:MULTISPECIES: hypothetical protein [Klebsiella]HAV7868250.1 hypothetical protein [Escherichia coli]HBT3501757.1 hypothetical protein [Klebsiella pneumoniae]HCI6570174.1 hypothetical protein [Klebsiella variicola subsp. variicola]MBC5114502.1 hypothetical protein [Klebsiella quasipneumoniae]STU61377.1 Uncharacterised protein [Klebsiella variicola]
MIKVGDLVRVRHKPGVTARVIKVTNQSDPVFTKVDVQYPNGQIETGLTLQNIDPV